MALSQAGITSVDAALNYNKLLIEKSENNFIRIGPYRVKGTPYLFGDNQAGVIYSKKQTLNNVLFSYNVHLNRIELTIQGSSQFVVLENADIDSFTLTAASSQGKHATDMYFINAKNINPKEKEYLQVLFKGNNFSLYKKYTCVLAIVSTNYVEADLRQFNYGSTYYYQVKNEDKLIKIKPGQSPLMRDFNYAPKCYTPVANLDFTYNKEAFLINFFNQADTCEIN